MSKKKENIEEYINLLKKNNLFLTDTHAHIHFEPLVSNIEDVLNRCKEFAVKRVINIGINIEDSRIAVKLAEKYSGIYAAVGVHPHDSNDFKLSDLGHFEKLLSHNKVIAVGEIGLDYFRNYSPKEVQKNVFRIFLDLAISFDKPIIIHNRDASEDLVKILNEMNKDGKLRGIIHCFNGDEIIMNWALDNGFMISFAGNVTYKKAVEIRSRIKEISLDRVLVETDSPYLAPVPKRGKTNEPAYVFYTAKFVANEYGIHIDEFSDIVESNVKKLFGELDVL